MSTNEINISINISDDLLGKLMTVAMASSAPMPLPQMLGALAEPSAPSAKKEKPPMAFALLKESNMQIGDLVRVKWMNPTSKDPNVGVIKLN